MATDNTPPFSARARGSHRQVDNDFPETARIGLLHLLHELVKKEFIEDWEVITRELARIGRIPPAKLGAPSEGSASEILFGLPWDRVYDFCERIHGYLAREVRIYVDHDDYRISVTRSEVQDFISSELHRLFLEEALAFNFREGVVHRRGRRHSVDQISRAEVVLGDPRLGGARKHYEKALHYFRDVSKPDFENAVKEAVCAVEAAGKALFPEAKAATLGDLVKWLSSGTNSHLPKTLALTLSGLYGFRSGGDGVGHGGASGGVASQSVAEYVLSVAASQIILLVDIANSQDGDVPF